MKKTFITKEEIDDPFFYQLFTKQFPEGKAEYETVLDLLVKMDNPSLAIRIIRAKGPLPAVLEVDELTGGHFFFAGSVRVKTDVEISGFLLIGGRIDVGGHLASAMGIKAGAAIHVGGSIRTDGGLNAGKEIEAGQNIHAAQIKAGGSVRAASGILTGRGIEAKGTIEAGKGWGIFAGLDVMVEEWPEYARVLATETPQNLLTGCWVMSRLVEETP